MYSYPLFASKTTFARIDYLRSCGLLVKKMLAITLNLMPKRLHKWRNTLQSILLDSRTFAATLHCGGAIPLSWRRSWPRTILYFGATNLLFCSSFGMVCTLLCACGRRIGMAHVRHRRLTPTLYALYHVGHFHHLLGLMASTPFLYKELLSKQHTSRGLAILAQFLCQSVYLHLYHQLALLQVGAQCNGSHHLSLGCQCFQRDICNPSRQQSDTNRAVLCAAMVHRKKRKSAVL